MEILEQFAEVEKLNGSFSMIPYKSDQILKEMRINNGQQYIDWTNILHEIYELFSEEDRKILCDKFQNIVGMSLELFLAGCISIMKYEKKEKDQCGMMHFSDYGL